MRLAPLAIAMLATALPLTSHAQDTAPTADEQILLKQVQTDKRTVYLQNLNLTESEGRVFWPIYDEYEGKVKKLDDAFVSLVNDFANKYETLSDADARSMLDRKLSIEKDRIALKDKYTRKIAKVLPATKALRYSQIETRIEILLRRNVYSLIPLAR
jgi:hypothetical protein